MTAPTPEQRAVPLTAACLSGACEMCPGISSSGNVCTCSHHVAKRVTPEQRAYLRRVATVATPGSWAAACPRETVLAILDALDASEGKIARVEVLAEKWQAFDSPDEDQHFIDDRNWHGKVLAHVLRTPNPDA